MSTRWVSSRSRLPQRRRIPFPRLPRTLITWEVAYQKGFGWPPFRGSSPDDVPPLLPEDLTRTERARLRQRAEVRYRPLRGDGHDWYWVWAELALSLTGIAPPALEGCEESTVKRGFSPDQSRELNHLPTGWSFREGQTSGALCADPRAPLPGRSAAS